jgi:uncharacterized repeat protein (TIGR01451 family)
MKIPRATVPAWTGLARTGPAGTTSALAVGLVALPAVMAAGHPVAPPQPGFTISVNDGRGAARTGDRLVYTVAVRDSGSVAATRVQVTQTISSGLTFISASDNGVARNGRVTWSASLPAGRTRTFRVTARVTRTPATPMRLATIACVELPDRSRPVVCAARLDPLPATAAQTTSRPGRSGSGVLTYGSAALAVLALGLYTGLAARRLARSRRRAA